jgi:hypothetical protein
MQADAARRSRCHGRKRENGRGWRGGKKGPLLRTESTDGGAFLYRFSRFRLAGALAAVVGSSGDSASRSGLE